VATPPLPDVDRVVAALAEAVRRRHAAIPGSWRSEHAGVVAAVGGLPIATMNTIRLRSPDVDPEQVAAVLDQVAATGLPHCLELRPGDRHLADLARARGMVLDEVVPLMAAVTAPVAHPWPDGLTVHRLEPAQAPLHVAVAAAGLGVDPGLLDRYCTPAFLATPGLAAYVGEVDGQLVTTCTALRQEGAVGVFDVATPPPFRRRGYAAAVTARAAADGLAAGCSFAWLQSSPMASGVYQAIGFATLERWDCWFSRPG